MVLATGKLADINPDRPDIDAKIPDQLVEPYLLTLSTDSRPADNNLSTMDAHHKLTDDHASALAANQQLAIDLEKGKIRVKWMHAKLRSLAQSVTGDDPSTLQKDRPDQGSQLEAEFEKYIDRIESRLNELENDSQLLKQLAGFGVPRVDMLSEALNFRGENPYHDVALSGAEGNSLLRSMAKQIGGDAAKMAEMYLDKRMNYSADQLELFERSRVVTPIESAMVSSTDQADIAHEAVKHNVEARAAVQQESVKPHKGGFGKAAELLIDDKYLEHEGLSQITEDERHKRAEVHRTGDSPGPEDANVTASGLTQAAHAGIVLEEGKGLQQRFEKLLRSHHDAQQSQVKGFATGKIVSSGDGRRGAVVTDKVRETKDDKATSRGQKFRGRNLVPVVFKYGFSTTIVKAPRGAVVERFGQKKIAGEDENKEPSKFLDINISTSHALKDLNKLSAHQALQDTLELSTSERKIADIKDNSKVLQSSVFLHNHDNHPQSQQLLNVNTNFTPPNFPSSVAHTILKEDFEQSLVTGTQMAPRPPSDGGENQDWSHRNGHDVTDQRRAVQAYRATQNANSSGTTPINQAMNPAQPSQATTQVSAANNMSVAQLMGYNPVQVPSQAVSGVQNSGSATSQTVGVAQSGQLITQTANPYIAWLNQNAPINPMSQAIAQALGLNPLGQTATQATNTAPQGTTSQTSNSAQATNGTSHGISSQTSNSAQAMNAAPHVGTSQTSNSAQAMNAAPHVGTSQTSNSAQPMNTAPSVSTAQTSNSAQAINAARRGLPTYQGVTPSPYMASFILNSQAASNVQPARATTQSLRTVHPRQTVLQATTTVPQATNPTPRGTTPQAVVAAQALNRSQVVSPYMASFTPNPQPTNVRPAQATTQPLGITHRDQIATQATNPTPNRDNSQTSNTSQAATTQTLNPSQGANTQQGGGYIARMINSLRAGNEFRPASTSTTSNTEASTTTQTGPSALTGNDSDAGNTTEAVNSGETGETQTTDNNASTMNVTAPAPLVNPHPVVNNLPRPVGYAMPPIIHGVVQGPQSVLTQPPPHGFVLNPRDDNGQLRPAQPSAPSVDVTINWQIPPGYTGIQPGQLSNSLVRANETPLFLEEGLRYQPGPAARSVHRTVLIRGIPDNTNANTITAAIQGGNIESIEFERLETIMGRLHPGRSVVARVVFFSETEALACEQHARRHGIVINGARTDVRVVETPTYPQSDEVDALIYHEQATRVLVISQINDVEGVDLVVDGEAGVIEPVRYGDDNEMIVELRSVRAAVRLAAAIAAREFGDVEFGPDPCNGA